MAGSALLMRLDSVQVIIMSLIIGSLFSNQSYTPNDARDFFGVSFLSVMFLSMGAMPELAITLSMKGCAHAGCFLCNHCCMC